MSVQLPATPSSSGSNRTSQSTKGKWIAALSTASVLVSTIPASAIGIDIVENSLTRLSFDVLWGPSRSLPYSDFSQGVTVIDEIGGGIVINVNNGFHIPLSGIDDFGLSFLTSGSSTRVFESSDLADFEGVQALELPGDPYGARFVYGTPYPATPLPGVPDGGSTAVMLGCAVVVGGFARRRFVSC
jgi:hypothetical protein